MLLYVRPRFVAFCNLKNEKDWVHLKFTQSLKKNHQFRFVYHKGKSYANKYLVVYTLTNHTVMNGLGISVSKKVGKSVVRSRVTRLIRESYRLNEDKLKNGYSIVVIARASCNGSTFDEINKSFSDLAKKHCLFL